MASVALRTGQPIGDLCDLLGHSREWIEVFDELLYLTSEEDAAADRAHDAAVRNQQEAAERTRRENLLAKARAMRG